MPQGNAMYVATESDRNWLLSKQRVLHARSAENPGYRFRKLWGLVTDPINLRIAFLRVARNRGHRTGGVDRMTVRQVIAKGIDAFFSGIRSNRVSLTVGMPRGRKALGCPAFGISTVRTGLGRKVPARKPSPAWKGLSVRYRDPSRERKGS